ncbi:GntR family transcriptional regulator [Pseudomonas sp. S3_C01]
MSTKSKKGTEHLAKQVVELIRDARFEKGHHLREQHIADALGVSRSPARAALSYLESIGAVEARRNQGFFLKLTPDELGRLQLEVPPANDEALYDQIVKERLAGLLPDTMAQTDISKRYAVDRVTMMKTLSRLAEDGLLMRNPGHGWTFQPSLEVATSLRGSYDFRSTIEPAGMLLPTFHVERATLEKSRREHLYLFGHPDLGAVSSSHLFEVDASFHEMLAKFSGNPFFLQATQQQNRLRRLLEFSVTSNRRRIREWLGEHLGVIDALKKEDNKKAAELLRSHISYACRATEEAIQKGKRVRSSNADSEGDKLLSTSSETETLCSE